MDQRYYISILYSLVLFIINIVLYKNLSESNLQLCVMHPALIKQKITKPPKLKECELLRKLSFFIFYNPVLFKANKKLHS